MIDPSSSSRPGAAAGPVLADRGFDVAIFDMDGVVTRTAEVHALAWQTMFNGFFSRRAEAGGEPFRPCDFPREYLAYIDGRPRFQGVATYLQARGVALPWGALSDAAGDDTVHALGNRKDELFHEILQVSGVRVYASTLALIDELRAAGIRVGLATSSRNATQVLARSGTTGLFATVVDGIVAADLGLAGKPAPDIFITAAQRLGATPDRAIVIEDAVSGVEAGARGGFALTIGLAREDNAAELRAHGANVVLGDLAEIELTTFNDLVLARRDVRRSGNPVSHP